MAHDSHDHEHADVSMDPHGFHAGDHKGHHVVSLRVLALVLGALLFFTVLTVALSRGEVWVADSLGVEIPQWVNVAIAMSIATVKGTLVALYFMQLRYDNPLNGIIFLFCLFAFAIFLGFTALDLSNRGHINKWEGGEIVQGGTGSLSRTTYVMDATADDGVVRGQDTVMGPIVLHAQGRKDVLAAAGALPKHYDYHGPDPSGDHAVVRSGLTPGLFDFSPHDDHDDHTDGHADGEHDEGDHDEDDHADDEH